MARFYGWPPNVILDLDIDTFDLFLKAIEPLEAQEFLVTLKSMDWPNLKENARTKLHSQMRNVAYNSVKTSKASKVKKISNEELAKILSMR